ncbi:Chromo domain/shadow [Penicillium concentricum]|uniref:Chromo domain/shadow n=1 Tax=Penicillium concentricum TaxID=293559 RepID=A0A9W9S6N7_9EURO|nr:Chromo domain/shadow [Penicillium concentricum]KAJ5373021.1 Chromo domain/shadow [Penicillium concentricum]
MASDSEMNNAFDESGVGDADSLASTAASEEETEYLVNDIHAERRFFVEPDSEDDEGIFITQYLVEWAGQVQLGAEGNVHFGRDSRWLGREKKQIAEGKVTPFDLKSWEKHTALLENKKKKRKEERRRKREQRARKKSLPRAGSSRLANPDVVDFHEPEAGIASHRSSRLSVDSTASALFVPSETPPPSKKVTSRQSQQQIAPPGSAISSAQATQKDPLKSTTLSAQTPTTLSQLPNSRFAQLAKKSTAKQKAPVRQKSPPQVPRPILSSFGTGPGAKRAYRDNKWGERAPDLSQMELMKPSEFAPRMNIGSTTSVVGPSVTSLKSPEAQNQPAPENPVSLPDRLKPGTGQISDKAVEQPKKPIVLAPSSVMAPPVPRSSNLGFTTSVSSSAVLPAPSAPSNLERPVGPVDSTISISSPATQSNPVPQANLIQPGDSANSIVSIVSPPGEAPLKNPAGRSTSALTAFSPASYPPSQVNIDRPAGPSVSTSSVFPSAILSGTRTEATSMKSARLTGSNLTPFSPAIPTKPRAMVGLDRPTENRDSQESRETIRGWDSYRPDSSRKPNTIMADTYRPSELSRRPSPSRRSPLRRRSPPSRRSRSRSPLRRRSPSRRSRSPGRAPRSSFRDASGSYAPRSPSPNYSQLASRSSNSMGLNENLSAKAEALAPTESGAGASGQPRAFIATQIPKMPARMAWPPIRLKIGQYWCFKGEALIHVFVGPNRRPLGAFRLCGIRSQVQQSLILANKMNTHQVEVWFKHLCTVRDYERLCESSEMNSVLSTGWIEGFSDTSKNLFDLAEDLRKDDLIAIHYPMGNRDSAGIVWVVWSRGSQEFKFPRPNDEVPPDVPLLIAARTMLAPIKVLGAAGSSLPSGRPSGLLPDTSSLRLEPSADDGLESGSPRQSNFHDMRMSGSLQPRKMPAPAIQSFSPASELKDNLIGANPPQAKIADQADQAGHQTVEEFLKKTLKINVEELATIEEGGKPSKAGIFYLHFPSGNEEVQEELQLLKAHLLEYHEKIVLTSDNPGDWEKFVQNSRQGVAIFHESFVRYDTLQPPLNSVLPTHSFNYWIVRIRRPLELVDPRFCSPSDHHLRIFPYGGVILLTEDVLTDLKGVAVTLQWIRNANRNKRKSWTLMFPPRILEWIERRLDDENHSQDHGLLLLIRTLIIKNNVMDPRTALFDEASLQPNSKSNVIAPSINEYEKVERDADHLIEFFAGWSLINIPRFRNFIAVTSLNAPAARWDKWGHVTVMQGGFRHFFKRFKVDSVGLMTYLSGSGGSSSKPRPSTGQVATPSSATTPQTPNWASHNANASIPATFTGSPNDNGTNKYPAPYK